MTRISLIFMFFFFGISEVLAQKVLEDVKQQTPVTSDAPGTFTERIKRISPSRRIFLLSNNTDQLAPGDFFSFILENKLVARSLVAKKEQGGLGTKLMRIYDSALWEKLKSGMDVMIIRGDDSYFSRPATGDGISTEDTIDDESKLLEGEFAEENTGRVIKTDNVLSLNLGQVSGINNDGSSQSYFHLSGSWMYQPAENLWAEFSYGQSTLGGFPQEQIDTKLSVITLRLKYIFNAPFYSHIQPYIGYSFRTADSPGAGRPGDNLSDADLRREIELVDALEKNTVVFGLTILKRLVPAWFAKFDLGTDVISGGLAIEF